MGNFSQEADQVTDVFFVEGSVELIDRLESLWKKLNKHHQIISTFFPGSISKMTFEQRKAYWLKVAVAGLLRIDIAVMQGSETPIGYCVTAIDNNIGEIESIFIEESFRKMGLGSALIERALKWLEREDVVHKRVNVAVGNEQVLPFYQKYGFYPRAVILEKL